MLADRVKRARGLVDAGVVKVSRRSKGGRARAWTMPSSSHLASWYEVFMKPTYVQTGNGDKLVRASFWCNRRWPVRPGQEPGMEKCQGNQRTVCYHCLAALVKAAKELRRTVQFVDTREKAQALSRLGVVVEMCGEGQPQAKVWAVMRKRAKRSKSSG